MLRLRISILVGFSVVTELFDDLLRLVNAAVRSQDSLVAEDLFLRKNNMRGMQMAESVATTTIESYGDD